MIGSLLQRLGNEDKICFCWWILPE